VAAAGNQFSNSGNAGPHHSWQQKGKGNNQLPLAILISLGADWLDDSAADSAAS